VFLWSTAILRSPPFFLVSSWGRFRRGTPHRWPDASSDPERASPPNPFGLLPLPFFQSSGVCLPRDSSRNEALPTCLGVGRSSAYYLLRILPYIPLFPEALSGVSFPPCATKDDSCSVYLPFSRSSPVLDPHSSRLFPDCPAAPFKRL